MKIMEWIKIGSVLVLMSFSKALAAPQTTVVHADVAAEGPTTTELNQTVALLDQFMQKMKKS